MRAIASLLLANYFVVSSQAGPEVVAPPPNHEMPALPSIFARHQYG
jgi:hypothetical protein